MRKRLAGSRYCRPYRHTAPKNRIFNKNIQKYDTNIVVERYIFYIFCRYKTNLSDLWTQTHIFCRFMPEFETFFVQTAVI